MKTKNKLLTDEQLALIEFAVEFLYNKQTKIYDNPELLKGGAE